MPIAHRSAEVRLRDSREGSPGPGITSGHVWTANSSGAGRAKVTLKDMTERRRDNRSFAVSIMKIGSGKDAIFVQNNCRLGCRVLTLKTLYRPLYVPRLLGSEPSMFS